MAAFSNAHTPYLTGVCIGGPTELADAVPTPVDQLPPPATIYPLWNVQELPDATPIRLAVEDDAGVYDG